MGNNICFKFWGNPDRKIIKFISSPSPPPYPNTSYHECCICLNSYSYYHSGGRKKLQCGHIFHNECIERWNEKNILCPICRKKNI
jgi:hypothetical protein